MRWEENKRRLRDVGCEVVENRAQWRTLASCVVVSATAAPGSAFSRRLLRLSPFKSRLTTVSATHPSTNRLSCDPVSSNGPVDSTAASNSGGPRFKSRPRRRLPCSTSLTPISAGFLLAYYYTLKMEPISFSETSGSLRTKLRYNSEGRCTL
jgi:hypothetical protein